MITILTDYTVVSVGNGLVDNLLEKEKNIKQFVLDSVDIKPCYSCGGCKTKTFKRCVFRDGADRMLPYLAQSKTIVVVTPIVYGGYSYRVKLIIDKLALIGDLHYYVNDREIVKGKDPSETNYYAIGVSEKNDALETEAFDFLVKETLLLTNWTGKAVVTDTACDTGEIAGVICQ